MKLVFVTTIVGIILFFPLNIEGSTCLFGYLTGLHFVSGPDQTTAMLNHYMRCFALPWWVSIGVSIWSYKTIFKKTKSPNIGGTFNA